MKLLRTVMGTEHLPSLATAVVLNIRSKIAEKYGSLHGHDSNFVSGILMATSYIVDNWGHQLIVENSFVQMTAG